MGHKSRCKTNFKKWKSYVVFSDPNAIKLGIFYYIQKYKQKYIKQKIKYKQKNFLYPEVSKYISKFLRKCQGVS